MANPEHAGSHHAQDKASFVKKFLKLLGIKLAEDRFKEELEKASKKWKEGQKEESSEKRREAQRIKEEKEQRRKYHEAKSAEVEEMEVQAARNLRASEIVEKLNNQMNGTDRVPDGAKYLFDEISNGRSQVKDALIDLLGESPAAAEVVNVLLTRGVEVHGDSRELFNLARTLSYEANKHEQIFQKIQPLLRAIGRRVGELLHDEFEVKQKIANQQRRQGPGSYLELLEEDPGINLSEDEKRQLSTPVRDGDKIKYEETFGQWERNVNNMVSERKSLSPEELQRAQSIAQQGVVAGQRMIRQYVGPIDKIWGEIERKEAKGQLSGDDLVKYQRDIYEEAAKIYPKDIPAGSEDYRNTVQALKDLTEEKYNILAEKLKQRLKEEKPTFRIGITDTEKFLEEMINHKGRFGDVIASSPEMYKLFCDTSEKGRRFRDRVFLRIHSAVLSDQRNSSQENFGLYERADFTTFNDLLRLKLKITVGETGRPLGETLADHFNTLSNAIRQSRDIDYWASQPAATAENWNKSLGMFQNEYVRLMTLMPGVNAAFRAYETVLRSIKTANDGYIPAALVEYDHATKTGFWDNWTEQMLRNMINAGVVPDIQRDNLRLEKVAPDGYSLLMSDKPLQLGDDGISDEELKMYKTLAKGLGMATARYLEIFATSKVPGVAHPEQGFAAFHSMPYEGVAKALNYFNIYVHKWKMGSYKYFYLLNQLIPNPENRITIDENDSTSGIRALMAYQDDTFEEKYGTDAKRFVDLTNFSGISSAIGKDTLWRQYDSTRHWSDRQRELLGGPTQLALAHRYAIEKVKEILVETKYKEMYRQKLIERNNLDPAHRVQTSGSGFDKLWKEYGRAEYGKKIDREWDELNGKDPKKGIQHTKIAEKTHHLISAYEKAFKARVWVEMAMRNPLVVGHSLKVGVDLVRIPGKKKMTLHQMLVQDILGIPPEDPQYGEEWGKAGVKHTPNEEQRKYMLALLQFEGDLAAVRERAINEGRDLEERDFSVIKDAARRGQAMEYWKKVQKVILGNNSAQSLYDAFGLKVMENGEDYEWDLEKIEELGKTVNAVIKDAGITINTEDGRTIIIPNLFETAVNLSPEWILGTDDMAFHKMDLLTLGSRQLLRRGGDILSHEMGGNAAVDFFVHGIHPTPDKQKMAELLEKVRDGYSGDMVEIGWAVAGNLAYMTDRLYAFDYGRLGSAAQLDVWKTRRGVAAWMANGRREWWDMLEHLDVVPPHAHFYGYDTVDKNLNIHKLREMSHATNADVWVEILTLGIVLATLLMIWKGLTAKDEEGEGGEAHH